MKINIGELDTNLITNQSLVGKTRTEIAGQSLIEVTFTDYLGQPLQGITSIIQDDNTGNEYVITTTQSLRPFGKLDTGSNLNAYWIIEDNKLRCFTSATTGSQVVTQVDKFIIKSLQTSDKEFTKFKFIR